MTSTAISVAQGINALVLDSPHSGTDYPSDFGFACNYTALRRAEDTHVERLYGFAPDLGCAWIEAHFPRSYLDPNRDVNEIDNTMLESAWPQPVSDNIKVRLGKGLFWKALDDGTPIYQRRLGVDEVKARIQRCWQPYHAAVEQAIAAAHARHGYSIHINCHSMPAVASQFATEFPGERHPDFVLGNRDHTTSSTALIELIQAHLIAQGYSVALNHPYKGVELVRRYSDPAAHRHSVQIELNCSRYMDEASREPHAGFDGIRQSLKGLVQMLTTADPRLL